MRKEMTLMVAVLLGITACRNTTNEQPEANVPLSIEAQIGSPNAVARYISETDTKSSFTAGDQIGLFRDELELVKWEYSESTWRSDEIMYWESATKKHDFHAFYPFTDIANTSFKAVPMPVLSNQSGIQQGIAAYDFLVAQRMDHSYQDNPILSFTGEDHCFKHISCLVKLTIKAEGDLEDVTLQGIILSGYNIASETTYSFDAEDPGVKFTTEATTSAVTASQLNREMSSDQLFYFVVNKHIDNAKPIKLELHYTKGENNYRIGVEQFETAFNEGMLQSYQIRVMNGVVKISGAEITEWQTDGETTDIIIDGSNKENY
ncbi:MAG: fimbrillin family protein [Phocaeicola sp.]